MRPAPPASGLRRRDPEAQQRATLLELFFDLVFVGVLALTSMTLAGDPSWTGAAKAILPLMAVWWIWTVTTLLADFYDPQQRTIKILLAGIMLGTSQLAVTAPHAFAGGGLVFAATFVAIHLGRGVLLTSVQSYRKDYSASRRTLSFMSWFGASAVPWLVGGLVDERVRFALWGLALAIDYVGGGLRYPTPWLGRVPKAQYDRAGEHLGERYQQFMILALGDMILVGILVYARVPHGGGHAVAAVLSFFVTLLMYQIYVNRAGSILELVTVHRPGRHALWAPYTHVVMIIGIISTAAGFELVIRRPGGTTPPGWAGMIIGGPALFMMGRITFEYEVFGRWSWARVAFLAALVATAPVVVFFVSPLLAAAISAGALLGIAITDQLRVRARASHATSHRHGTPDA
ncbi:low temperature requirement protein A [Rugosimonospora acidiphila]|uniref:Low temperature requirement protein A n=1 Tax=Rugosimonospora acidiphila TaxID=556531 RepID=A0ABP9SBK4_9ACTN